MTLYEQERVRERAINALLELAESKGVIEDHIRVSAATAVLHAPMYEDDIDRAASSYGGTD